MSNHINHAINEINALLIQVVSLPTNKGHNGKFLMDVVKELMIVKALVEQSSYAAAHEELWQGPLFTNEVRMKLSNLGIESEKLHDLVFHLFALKMEDRKVA